MFSEPKALYRFLQGRGGRRVRVGSLQSILCACPVAGDRGLFQACQRPPVVRWVFRLSGPGWAPECGGLCGRRGFLGLSLDGFEERAGLGLSGMGRLLES